MITVVPSHGDTATWQALRRVILFLQKNDARPRATKATDGDRVPDIGVRIAEAGKQYSGDDRSSQ